MTLPRGAMLDFETNALGTLNLLEATRRHAPDACFIFMSTNKVYGDAPNCILCELPTRWDFADPICRGHRRESYHRPVDPQPVGASKVAADVLVQEYGRYFG